MRFSTDQNALFEKHKKALSQAGDEPAIRQVLKAAQQELAHPAYHELGKLARARISTLSPRGRGCPEGAGEGETPVPTTKKGTKS